MKKWSINKWKSARYIVIALLVIAIIGLILNPQGEKGFAVFWILVYGYMIYRINRRIKILANFQ